MAKHLLTTIDEDFKALSLPLPTEIMSEDSDEGNDISEVKAVRTKRHTASERRKWRKAKKKGKAKSAARKYRKKASVKRMLKKHKLKAAKMRHGKPAGRKRLVFTGLDRISNLLENAQSILNDINDEAEKQNLAAGFVAVANVAESLVTALTTLAEAHELDADEVAAITRLIKDYKSVAVSAKARVAREASDKLAEEFRVLAGSLVEGLKLVSSLNEDEDEDFDDEDDEDFDDEDDLEEDFDDEDDEEFEDDDDDLEEDEDDDFDLDYEDEDDDEDDLDECMDDEDDEDFEDDDEEEDDEDEEDDEGN